MIEYHPFIAGNQDQINTLIECFNIKNVVTATPGSSTFNVILHKLTFRSLMETSMETLRYPTGRFVWPKEVSDHMIFTAINVIDEFPARINRAIGNLDSGQLDTPYRPDGWTIRQVVHHCADSHMNAYIRFKLALTEETPTIKPYDQASWAELADSQILNPDISLSIIEGVHTRWVTIMKNMTGEEWDKTFLHPEHNEPHQLRQVVIMYQWHCNHHLAHITQLCERMQWIGTLQV